MRYFSPVTYSKQATGSLPSASEVGHIPAGSVLERWLAAPFPAPVFYSIYNSCSTRK